MKARPSTAKPEGLLGCTGSQFSYTSGQLLGGRGVLKYRSPRLWVHKAALEYLPSSVTADRSALFPLHTHTQTDRQTDRHSLHVLQMRLESLAFWL